MHCYSTDQNTAHWDLKVSLFIIHQYRYLVWVASQNIRAWTSHIEKIHSVLNSLPEILLWLIGEIDSFLVHQDVQLATRQAHLELHFPAHTVHHLLGHDESEHSARGIGIVHGLLHPALEREGAINGLH